MKIRRALMITACLAGVVVVSAAFMNLHNGNMPRDFNTNGWELIGFVQHKTNGAFLSASKAGFENDTNKAK